MCGVDVFILFFLVEGLFLVLLEVMFCGLVCIVIDVGVDGEVLEKGVGIILNIYNVIS